MFLKLWLFGLACDASDDRCGRAVAPSTDEMEHAFATSLAKDREPDMPASIATVAEFAIAVEEAVNAIPSHLRDFC